MKQVCRYYDDVRDEIEHGSVLLFRPDKVSLRSIRWLWGIPIARWGRSPYCHAGMVAVDGSDDDGPGAIRCLEVLEGSWKREPRLLSQVLAAHYPGQIDVYQVVDCMPLTAKTIASRAVFHMRRLVRKRYSYWTLFRLFLRKCVVTRLFFRTPTDDTNGRACPHVCSGAVAAALQDSECDPVPNLPAAFVEPGDLARTLMLTYQCTLLPGKREELT